MNKQTVPFTKEAVKKYLDDCIIFSRKIYDSGGKEAAMCAYYIDAYQSIRTSLFGETLALEFNGRDGSKIQHERVTTDKSMIRIGKIGINPKYIVYFDLDVDNGEDWTEISITLNASENRRLDANGNRMQKVLTYQGERAIEIRDWLLKNWHFEMELD